MTENHIDASTIKQAIEIYVPGSQVSLVGEGCNLTAIVVSAEFEGLSPVKRQQQVLKPVTAWIASGVLHAFSVEAYTPIEWEESIRRNHG